MRKGLNIKNKKVSIANIVSILCIWIAIFTVGTIDLTLPGIYYDAVYPDYLAAIGAFPGIDNFSQITKHVGLPLLGNFYHGTMTAGLQYIFLKCLGFTSQITLRIPNLIYYAVICSIIYELCRKICKSNIIPLAGALLCAIHPNVITLPRTQYYIMLPGCVLFFCSFFILFSAENGISKSKILLLGILQGLAFYGYFTYLFLAPVTAAIIIYIYKGSKKQKILLGCGTYLLGIFIGSVGYIIGYGDSLITNLFGYTVLSRVLLAGYVVCLMIYILFWLFFLLGKDNRHLAIIRKIFIVANILIICVAFIVGAVFLLNHHDKLQRVLNLLVLSQTRNEGNRYAEFCKLMYVLFTGKSSQQVMFWEYLNDYFDISFWICIFMIIPLLVTAIMKKAKIKEDKLLKFIVIGYSYLIGYYIFTLPIVLGMQPQHFVVTYFLLFMVTIMDTAYILRNIPTRFKVMVGALLFIWVSALNIYNDSSLIEMLNKTHGRGKYSDALDWFAFEAYENADRDKFVYVFPQWGFMANFIYLTQNSCRVIRDADIDLEELQNNLDAGDTLVIAAIDKKSIEDIISELEIEDLKWEERHSFEGDYVFSAVIIN